MKYTLGLDLGQSSDPTALCIIEEHRPEPLPPWQRNYSDAKSDNQKEEPIQYHCRHLYRFPLGTKYPAIVQQVGTLLASGELRDQCELVVDASGVGRPVVDMFTARGLYPVPVTITGGIEPNYDNGMWKVPKRILVSTVQVLLQTHRLEIADLPDRATLIKELLAFQVTITEAANDVYAGRTGTHDDLVLAVALAAWKAEYNQRTPAFCYAIASFQAG